MTVLAFLALAALGQTEETAHPFQQPLMGCHEIASTAPLQPDPLLQRLLRYTEVAVKHRIRGLASYYSSFFDGQKDANGEVFRNGKYSAAHLTVPLGTWIEVQCRR